MLQTVSTMSFDKTIRDMLGEGTRRSTGCLEFGDGGQYDNPGVALP